MATTSQTIRDKTVSTANEPRVVEPVVRVPGANRLEMHEVALPEPAVPEAA